MTSAPIFCCAAGNDLYRACAGEPRRVPDPVAAVAAAGRGSAVLILADGYPDVRTQVDAQVFRDAAAKGVRLYVEFPGSVPGVRFEEPRVAAWERLVVLDERFGAQAGILAPHSCTVVPAERENAYVRLARVAGYDRAVFGLPEQAPAVLFEAGPDVLVATTKLSHVTTGRYAPVADWSALWTGILRWLLPEGPVPDMLWTPTVRPALGPTAELGPQAERDCLARANRWHRRSEVLLSAGGEREVRRLLARAEVEAVPREALPGGTGDGRHGLLEGFESAIQTDGSQRVRLPLRADSVAETAMVLAESASYSDDPDAEKMTAAIAGNLMDYLYDTSGMCGGDRGDPAHPSYGLIAWGVGNAAWEVANYGDDNARVLLASLAVAARSGSDRWTEQILRAVLANLRTTGPLGFRGDRIDMPALSRNGWRHYFQAETLNRAPHFESYLWACYLWAYRLSGEALLLERAKAGITGTMAAFPGGWRRNDVTEPSRMLLPLAWLVRIEDTAEHRGWLDTIVADVLQGQDVSGAIPERECGGPGMFQAPRTNEEYGQSESPLIHETGDPASDQLYTTGFALLGLHEAAAATGDPDLAAQADRLAAYLIRIQTRSERADLDGTWLRGFDFSRWDYFSSSGDMGWGAWSIELGWGQAWIVATLALRQARSSLWERAAAVVPEPELVRKLLQEMELTAQEPGASQSES